MIDFIITVALVVFAVYLFLERYLFGGKLGRLFGNGVKEYLTGKSQPLPPEPSKEQIHPEPVQIIRTTRYIVGHGMPTGEVGNQKAGSDNNFTSEHKGHSQSPGQTSESGKEIAGDESQKPDKLPQPDGTFQGSIPLQVFEDVCREVSEALDSVTDLEDDVHSEYQQRSGMDF